MDDKNKDLPLVVSEILIEMQQMRQEMRADRQVLREEMRSNTEQLANTMSKLIGTLTEHLIETRDTVKSIDKRLANVEQKVTEFVDFDRRLRVLEDIVLKKAS